MTAVSDVIRIADVLAEPAFKPAKVDQCVLVDWIDASNSVRSVKVRVKRVEARQFALVCPTCGGLSGELRLHYEGRGTACSNCILGLQPIRQENSQSSAFGFWSDAVAGQLLSTWYERIRNIIEYLRS